MDEKNHAQCNGLKLVLWQYSYLYAPTFSREILCKSDQSGAKLSGMFRPVLWMKNHAQWVENISVTNILTMFMQLYFHKKFCITKL